MSSRLPVSHSPSRSGRPRNKGANATGTSDGAGSLLRGALSGNIGASPFGILATTPELPVSSGGACLTASGTSRASPSASSRTGHAGLSLRRANSLGNGTLGRTISGGVTPVVPPAFGGGRRALLLRRLGAALVIAQMVLICALIARPALVHSLSGVAKSASVGLWALHHGDRGGALENAAIDETSTVAIVNKLAADSRRSARAESSTASRRERMWPTAAGLSTRQQQQQQGAAASQRGQGSASSSHPVYLVAAAANTTQIRKADSVAAADAEAKGMTVADAAVITKNATAAALGTGTKAAVSDAKSTSSAAAGGTAKAVATTVPKSASFPPFKEPVVPFPGRAANAPPIVGVVFYGRRDRVRILDCYLQRNMIRNGGLLAYVVFVTATWQPQDVEFLDRLVAARGGDYRKLYPQRLDKGYTGHYAWMDPATLYVKVDDDVVYIADHAIDHMLIAHNLHRYHLISANVINHQPLELPHSQAGAHFTFEQTRPGDKASWQPAMRPATAAAKAAGAAAGGAAGATAVAPALERVPFMDNGWDVWGDWRRAANVHYSFLANHAAGRLGVYDFPPAEQLWDFNRHFGYTRWRINMIMFKGATIDVHVYNMSSTIDTYPGDDEDFITRILPKQLNRTSAAVSQALAVHFSFFMQRAGLENNTDLLDRYTLLAERTCGRLISASP